MQESRDHQVRKFLHEMQDFDRRMYTILQQLRQLVLQTHPDIKEHMMYGGIMFSLEGEDFGGIFAYKRHVSFEFSAGAQMLDADKQLEGKGKYRRHLKYTNVDEISAKNTLYFVNQALSMG